MGERGGEERRVRKGGRGQEGEGGREGGRGVERGEEERGRKKGARKEGKGGKEGERGEEKTGARNHYLFLYRYKCGVRLHILVQFLPFSLEMEQRICDIPSTSWREQRPDRGCYRWRRTTHVTREGEGGKGGGEGKRKGREGRRGGEGRGRVGDICR